MKQKEEKKVVEKEGSTIWFVVKNLVIGGIVLIFFSLFFDTIISFALKKVFGEDQK